MGPRLFSRGNSAIQSDCTTYRKASMGPRLFSRGNPSVELRHFAELVMLQWGHDFSAVEISKFPKSNPIREYASMGPRLFSRGNHGSESAESTCHRAASMGPRLFSRGNLDCNIQPIDASSRFNGATTFQPWKSQSHVYGTHEIRCASMGPRLFSRGNHAESLDTLDQLLAASMGPRLFSRGNGQSMHRIAASA